MTTQMLHLKNLNPFVSKAHSTPCNATREISPSLSKVSVDLLRVTDGCRDPACQYQMGVLAVVYACASFHMYIYRCSFIGTNHNPIEMIAMRS